MAKVKSGPKSAGHVDKGRKDVNSKRLRDKGVDAVFYLLLPLLFLAPFFRGLFFYEELNVAHMYTAVIAGVYFYLNRDKLRFSKSIMDYAGAGLVIAYLLSSFVAVSSRGGIGLVMKNLNYFLVYLLVAQVVKNTDQIKKILITVFTSGVIVALIGLGNFFGSFETDGGVLDGLICSTIQYHNATAIFLFAIGMLGLALTVYFKDGFARTLTAGATYVAIITAMGAGSRGALLVTPIAMLIQFLGLPRADKEKYFYTVLAVTVPLVITSKSVLTLNVENSDSYYWGILFLGFFLSCLIQFGFDRFINLSGKTKRGYILSTGAIVAVALAAVVVVKGAEIMPASVVDRVKEFNLQNNNVLDRFNFYEDAVKVVKDHPVLGVGGGGWKSIYRSYQNYWYDTTEVHSHFFQVLVETGALGFILYLLLWLGLLISSIRLLRSASPEMKLLTWTAFSTAIGIGMHSAIDFTLSLGAISILLWFLMGLVRAGEEQTFGNDNYFSTPVFDTGIRKIIGIIISVVFFAASASFFWSTLNVNKAIDTYQQGDLEGAIATMEFAVKLDPYTTKNLTDLSIMYTEKASRGDVGAISQALSASEKAVQNDSGDGEVRWHLAKAYYNSRNMEKGVQTAEEAVNLAPFVTRGYIQLAMYYNAVAQFYLQAGDKETAHILLEKTLAIPERMKMQASKLDEEGRRLFKGTPLDAPNGELDKMLAEARGLLSRL